MNILRRIKFWIWPHLRCKDGAEHRFIGGSVKGSRFMIRYQYCCTKCSMKKTINSAPSYEQIFWTNHSGNLVREETIQYFGGR